jgi:hypothetical protein
MAYEQGKDEQARKPVKIEDLSDSTDASVADQVKGGMISRSNFGPTTTDDDDEVGE